MILHSLCHMQYHIYNTEVQQALATGFHFKNTVPCTDQNSYRQTNGECSSTHSQHMTRWCIGMRTGNVEWSEMENYHISHSSPIHLL